MGIWQKSGFSGVERGASAVTWSVALKLAAGLAMGVGLLLPACGSDDEKGCDGVTIDGQCQKKCVESACAAAGMKCISNACEQSCKAPTDCPVGKVCYGNVTSDDGTATGQFCGVAPYAVNDGGTGQYEPCASDAECDTFRGYKCVQNECRLTGCKSNADCATVPGTCVKDPSGAIEKNYCQKSQKVLGVFEKCTKTSECDTDIGLGCVDGECRFVGCHTHTDCAAYGSCKTGKDDTGKEVLACVKGTTNPPGQFGTLCPSGPTGTECDKASGFVCLGAGEGDIDAYCTKTGCQADGDCALGYYCSTVRTSKKPCATACGITGSTGTDCVSGDKIGDGKEYSCGPVSLLRNYCMKRDFCTTCATDDDCREMPNQVCADEDGTKICTNKCNPETSGSCPWGNATTCDPGSKTCKHRFGSCAGAGKSCEPCVEDTDCPNGLCLSSSFSGEKYCVSLDQKCACLCTQDSECYDGAKCHGVCKDSSIGCTADAECGTCLPKAGGTTPIGCTAAAATGCVGDLCTVGASTCNKTNGNCGLAIDQDVYCLGGGCPKTPGNATMQCYGGAAVKDAKSPLYNTCVGANVNVQINGSPQIGCWLPL